MSGESDSHSDEFLRGEPDALEIELEQDGFYAEEAKNQLEKLKVYEAVDSLFQDCTMRLNDANSVKSKISHGRYKESEKIRGLCVELLPELGEDIKSAIESAEALFDEFVSNDEIPELPETHLELLERYTTISHDSVLLKMRLSQAKADLEFIRSEME